MVEHPNEGLKNVAKFRLAPKIMLQETARGDVQEFFEQLYGLWQKGANAARKVFCR
jgi:hypothetical protein